MRGGGGPRCVPPGPLRGQGRGGGGEQPAALVVQRVGERGPVALVDAGAREPLERRAGLLAVLVVGHLAARVADDGEPVRQEAAGAEVVDGRQELATGEGAGRAEDDEHGRNRSSLGTVGST